ncbi:hypothetical protein [Methanoregula formicica]|uniref:hypothetical protein n=1 Tax=Methanoregula formicica TaxID=882104 RepID=UPI00064E51A6|nr:hypothetical protein [Methanoregula formicica]
MTTIIPEGGDSIKEFIDPALVQIREAVSTNAIVGGTIVFEMSTYIQKDKSGKLDIKVLNIGQDVSSHQIQKITIPIKILTESEKAVEAVKKAKAEAAISHGHDEKSARYAVKDPLLYLHSFPRNRHIPRVTH